MGPVIKSLLTLIILVSVGLLQTKTVDENEVPTDYSAVVNADFGNQLILSPDQTHLLVAKKSGFMSFQRMQDEKYVEVAGVALNQNSAMTRRNQRYGKLSILNMATKAIEPVNLPSDEILDFAWSPHSDKLAMILRDQNGKLNLWLYSLDQKRIELWRDEFLAIHFSRRNIIWLPDNNSVVVKRSLMTPAASETGYAAYIKDAQTVSASCVYRNTMADLTLLADFHRLAKHQLLMITPDATVELGSEGFYGDLSISPDGEYLLAESIMVDSDSLGKLKHFPRRHQVFSLDDPGKTEFLLETGSSLPTGKVRDGAPEGKRAVQWHPDKPATLSWVEAKQTGGIGEKNTLSDVIKALSAPFVKSAEVITESNWRVHEYFWTETGRLVFVDWRYSEKRLRVWSLMPQKEPMLLVDHYYPDKYKNPGDIDISYNTQGIKTATTGREGQFYFFGQGLSVSGKRPFIDSVAVDGNSQRIYQSPATQLTAPLYVMRNEQLLAISESTVRPPTLVKIDHTQTETELVGLIDPKIPYIPVPPLHIEFQRQDGLIMRTDIYLPSDEELKYPAVVWVYPRETSLQRGQQRISTESKFLTLNPLEPLVILLEGVAVVDMSNFPLTRRHGNLVNDSFVEQHIENSAALIAALEKTGRIDTSRLLVMGHSYGAFSAANLLAHTDDYITGIVRSGAYNRTITPLGFQRERRNLWEAKDMYINISPLFSAHKIEEPLLIVHGVLIGTAMDPFHWRRNGPTLFAP